VNIWAQFCVWRAVPWRNVDDAGRAAWEARCDTDKQK
jgi:hypothetical protein